MYLKRQPANWVVDNNVKIVLNSSVSGSYFYVLCLNKLIKSIINEAGIYPLTIACPR